MKTLEQSILSTKWKPFHVWLKKKKTELRFSTGIAGLDSYLNGLGNFVNIQGETSSCKSCLGLQIVHANMQKGMPCIMVDKENGDGRVISRLLCQAGKVSEEQLRLMSDNDRLKLEKSVDQFRMHLHTEPIEDHEALRERVAQCYEKYDKQPFMIFFDSIQAADTLTDDQRVNLEQWVYFLDRLKVEYNGKLTVIIVSEKNRAAYGQQGTGGGKGSNIIDYKPETVLDIKWKGQDDNGHDSGRFTLQVSKHRDGECGGTFELKKVLSDPTNRRSFCFLLEECSEDDEEEIDL